MTFEEFMKGREWKDDVRVTVNDRELEFAIFDWAKVKERPEDGQSNVWEYFIGWDGTAFDRVEAGDWVPFGAGGMSGSALKYDGGFQEMGHTGMLFADTSRSKNDPPIYYYDLNESEEPVEVASALSAIVG